MKRAIAVLLAAVAGIHCSDGADATPPGAALPVGGEVAEPDATEKATPPRPDTHGETHRPASVDDDASGIVSTALGADGALYATGTFRGSVSLGQDTLTSRGDLDVFLVRYEADGRVAWTRSIGSVFAESAPSVKVVDGKVQLIAKTQGAVDCGSGDLGKWSSAMFFLCHFTEAGEALGGGTFPTGSP